MIGQGPSHPVGTMFQLSPFITFEGFPYPSCIILVTSGTLFCFDIQVWLENQLQLGGKSRDPLSSVMKGNFSGMDILGANSDSPIVVTIFKRELFSSICLIGKLFLF